MYFEESETLVKQHPDYSEPLDKLDRYLHRVQSKDPRIEIPAIAAEMQVDEASAERILDWHVLEGTLQRRDYVVCPACQFETPGADIQRQRDDGDEPTCDGCGEPLPPDSPLLIRYLMGQATARGATAREIPAEFSWFNLQNFGLLRYYSADNLAKSRPLEGKRVFLVLHFLRDLLPFVEACQLAGMDLNSTTFFFKPYPYPHKEALITWLRANGAEVLQLEEISSRLTQEENAADEREVVIVEDGGYIVPQLVERLPKLRGRVRGVVEQTTRGLRHDERVAASLSFPVLSVASCRIKVDLEPTYIGAAVVTNMRRLIRNTELAGKAAAVVGYGAIGQAVVKNLTAAGVNVTVYEADAVRANRAKLNSLATAASAREAVRDKNFVFGTTGNVDRPSIGPDEIGQLRHGAYLISTASDQNEIAVEELERQASSKDVEVSMDGHPVGTRYKIFRDRSVVLVANGYPINFWFDESMVGEAADMIMSVLYLALLHVAEADIEPGIHPEVVDALLDELDLPRKFAQLS